MTFRFIRRRSAFRTAVSFVAALTLPVALACDADQILDVEDIDVAVPGSVEDPAALPSILAGAIGDFGAAWNGPGDFNQVSLAGQLSDELQNTETFPTRIENDQRRQSYQSNGSLRDAFYAVQQGRASADFAVASYQKLEQPTNVGVAEALNLSALSYIIMAENYCGSVPISTADENNNFTYGAALTTTELLNVAVRKADSALANATAAGGAGTAAKRTEQARVARIVKARALLDQNKLTEAVAAIGGDAGVPTTFQYIYKHSETTGRQNNGTWGMTLNGNRFGVPDREGGNGLPFRSEGNLAGTIKDPRVPNSVRTSNGGRGFDNATTIFYQQKYSKRDTLAIIADGVEARLIEAEGRLRANDYAGALTIMNALRANSALFRLRGYLDADQQPVLLAALPAAATAAAQVDQLFKERAYWMYLTSHRLGDLRRLIRQYARTPETVFPTGSYHKSGTYGTDVNSPIPQAEDNNPNFNRAGCVATQA
jgi:hypothetical protein